MLRDGQDHGVPTLIGFTAEEGLLYTRRFSKSPAFLARFMADWGTCGPVNFLGLEGWEVTQEHRDQVDTLRAAYPAGTEGLTDMFTDAVFAASSHQVARLLTSNNRTVYKYLFTYRGSTSLADLAFSSLWSTTTTLLRGLLRISWGPSLGAAHGEELIYLFQLTPFLDLLPSPADQQVSRSMTSWWATFAKGGRPDPEWEPAVEGGDYSYWVVDTRPGMEERKELERLEQWL